jgi:hypothetical protein
VHRQHVSSNSSATVHTSSIADHSSGDGGLMAKFLETQPYGLESPGSSGRHVAGAGARRSSIDLSQLADRQGGLAAAEARADRRTTDLVGESWPGRHRMTVMLCLWIAECDLCKCLRNASEVVCG